MAYCALSCCAQGHIVAEVCDREHEALMHTLATGLRLRTVMSREMIGRMMVQCARYPHLALVVEELIGQWARARVWGWKGCGRPGDEGHVLIGSKREPQGQAGSSACQPPCVLPS